MAEEKILIPPYKRIGACEACGADVYAPDVKQAESGWPLMSACACKRGPRVAGKPLEQGRAAGAHFGEQAQAA